MVVLILGMLRTTQSRVVVLERQRIVRSNEAEFPVRLYSQTLKRPRTRANDKKRLLGGMVK